jgi:hypothetical protein
MNNTVANLYEFCIHDSEFSNAVYDANDYVFLMLGFLIIPFIILLLFYRLVDPIPVKLWKWMVAVLISVTIVFAFSYYWLSSNSMYNYIMTDYSSVNMSAMSFTLLLCIWSVVFSIIPTILFSWIFSRTISINNAKNPF